MDKEIGKIAKGEYQGTKTDIVVGIKEYNGKIGVDIREFTQSEAYTGPTKKGLRIPSEKFEDFRKIINSIKTEDLQNKITEDPRSEPSETDNDEAGIDKNGLM